MPQANGAERLNSGSVQHLKRRALKNDEGAGMQNKSLCDVCTKKGRRWYQSVWCTDLVGRHALDAFISQVGAWLDLCRRFAPGINLARPGLRRALGVVRLQPVDGVKEAAGTFRQVLRGPCVASLPCTSTIDRNGLRLFGSAFDACFAPSTCRCYSGAKQTPNQMFRHHFENERGFMFQCVVYCTGPIRAAVD